MSTILLVDDDADVLDIVKGMLAPLHSVLTTTDPHEALEVLERQHIDLLVTDIRMPSMTGFNLAELARQHRPGLPVIMMSAFFDQVAEGLDELARNLVHKYAGCALAKPISRQTINAAVDSVLAAANSKPPPKAATHPMHFNVH